MSIEKEPPLTTDAELDSTRPETVAERRRRIGIMAGAAILLSLAATFGANKAAENRVAPMPTAIEYDMADGRTLGAGVETGMYDIIPGEGGTVRLPGVEISTGIKDPDGTAIERTNPSTEVQLMEWARKFDVDPLAAEPRGEEAIDDTVERIDQLRSDGWHIDSITFQGFASDEGDDRNGDNPGFGMPTNEKNIRLADKRAEAVRMIFQEKYFGRSPDYQDQDGEDMTQLIHVEQGQEVRDDQLAADIDALAESMDMPTDDLVMQFNRDPESLPAEAREVLEGLYGDRYVRIEIEASREVVVPGEEKTDSIILIPIFIPIFRRRQGLGPIPTRIGESKTTMPSRLGESKTPIAPESKQLIPDVRQSKMAMPEPEPVIYDRLAESKTIIPEEIPETPVRPRFPHPPKKIGEVNPGYARMAQRIKQPDTSNAHYGKGSGGKVGAYRRTTHRGHSR